MSREVLQQATNAIKSVTIDWLETFEKNFQSNIVLPQHLDILQESLYQRIKNQFSETVGRKYIRTQIVSVILDEKGVGFFGVEPSSIKKNQITDKAIKKYSKK